MLSSHSLPPHLLGENIDEVGRSGADKCGLCALGARAGGAGVNDAKRIAFMQTVASVDPFSAFALDGMAAKERSCACCLSSLRRRVCACAR